MGWDYTPPTTTSAADCGKLWIMEQRISYRIGKQSCNFTLIQRHIFENLVPDNLKCMHMLITLYSFPYPPHAVGPFNSQTLPELYASVGTIKDHRGTPVQAFYTNGAELVGEEALDVRLRNLLMRCLALLPNQRPGLVELEAWALDVEMNPGFFDDIEGVLTSTELAEQFICRPRSVSSF